MAEKEHPKEEKTKKRDKTIVLSEWQKKNQAYLEKKAKEKAEKAASDAKEKEEQQAKIEALRKAAEQIHGQSDEETSEKEEQVSGQDSQKPSEKQRAVAKAQQNNQTGSDDKDEQEESDQAEPAGEDDSDQSDDHKTSSSKKKKSSPLPAKLNSGKPKPIKDPESVRKTWKLIFKALPLLMTAVFFLVASLYFISPWSRLKTIEVTGNAQVSKEDILAVTGISDQDYTLTTFVSQSRYSQQVEDSLLWVKSASLTYSFPDRFNFQLEEHKAVGYIKDGGDFYPVLSSGDVIDRPVTESEVNSAGLTFQLTDLDMIKSFVLTLEELDGELLSRVESVSLSPTSASQDLLSLNMREGHMVLVPLSGLREKMTYYSQVASKLTSPSVIDMEAGIYSYAK